MSTEAQRHPGTSTRLPQYTADRVRWWTRITTFAIVLFVAHGAFTLLIRGYVVPSLTPNAHWRYGLQKGSDSHAFQLEAVRSAQTFRESGWAQSRLGDGEGLSHARFIGALYYVTGSDSPVQVYALNGAVFVTNGLLLLAMLFRYCGLPRTTALAISLLLSFSPLYLFSHSELLREPYTVFGSLLFLAALLEMTQFRNAPSPLRYILAAIVCAAGFIVVTSLRPYLMLPLLSPLLAASIVLMLSSKELLTARLQRVAVLMALTMGLTYFHVLPETSDVQQYADQSARPGQIPAEQIERWKRTFVENSDKVRMDRADFLVPHWCTLEWNRSTWLPAYLDAKFEAIACARQDFLRFCDQSLLGRHADRHCNGDNFTAAGPLLQYTPRALAFGLLAPYPYMWVDGFDSDGTGLRRVGYVLDGLLSYPLILGLVGLFAGRSDRPEILAISIALIAIITLYALAIPSQFILARIRLALYVPLLAFGAAGWCWCVAGLDKTKEPTFRS